MSLYSLCTARGEFVGWPRVWCTRVPRGISSHCNVLFGGFNAELCLRWGAPLPESHHQPGSSGKKAKHPINQPVWSKFFIYLFIWIFPLLLEMCPEPKWVIWGFRSKILLIFTKNANSQSVLCTAMFSHLAKHLLSSTQIWKGLLEKSLQNELYS